MKRIFLKLALLSLPILFILLVYAVKDPYKVLYHYDAYYPNGHPNVVELNLEYVTMETLMRYYPRYHYDSYILGGSRCIFYHMADWKKHINSERVFHLNAYRETLRGIEQKLQYLQAHNMPLRNALILLDYDALVTKDSAETEYQYKRHPMFENKGWLRFQAEYFMMFLNWKVIYPYFKYLATGKVDASYRTMRIDERQYEPATNESTFPQFDDTSAAGKLAYYKPRMGVFYQRSKTQQNDSALIGAEQTRMLLNIRSLLTANNTDYRIVISPLYNQHKLAEADIAALHAIFGQDKVFDFSGINDMTESIYNFYETSHFRPFVAARIMDSIYAHKQ